MRKRTLIGLALAGALAFSGVAARAQTATNVTATIKDTNGIPYANGTYSVQLVPSTASPTVNGQSIRGAFNGALDATGSLNIALWANSSISPGGTTWQFTVCSNPGGIAPPLGTGGQCTPPTSVTISGATQSLSSTLSAAAPSLTNFVSSSAIGGSIANTQVAVGTGPGTIGGSAALTFANTNLLTVGSLANTFNAISILPGTGSLANCPTPATDRLFLCGIQGGDSADLQQSKNGGSYTSIGNVIGSSSATGYSNVVITELGTSSKVIQTAAGVSAGGGLITLGSPAASTGKISFDGLTSGFATLGVNATAGTPAQINLPTSTGAPGQVLSTDGGTPQQTSWVTAGTVAGSDNHTAEITGNYGPVTLLASGSSTGFYLVTIYTEVSTGVATSTVTASISYADDTGAQTQSGALFSAAVTGTIQSLTFPVRFVTGTALTYSASTANSPKYKIFARVLAE